jgi:hypothetical protein
MKCLSALTVAASLGLVACDTLKSPITSSGDFDPLRPPGSSSRLVAAQQGPSLSAGQFVRASMDNTAFFKNKPSGAADADKLLKRNTSMKVVSTSGTFVKVELDSGEVGFVPAIMVEDPAALVSQTAVPGNGVYQVYPPLPQTGAGEPLPILDPSGLPPDGAIPTIIDPDAPVEPPVPPVTSSNEAFPTVPAVTPDQMPPSAEPKVETVPLPPGSDEQ